MSHIDLLLTPLVFPSLLFSCSLYQYNRTPLYTAASKGYTEVVIALLDRGANTEAKTNVSEYAVLLLAAARGGYVYYVGV
jgi:hypothetical protein